MYIVICIVHQTRLGPELMDFSYSVDPNSAFSFKAGIQKKTQANEMLGPIYGINHLKIGHLRVVDPLINDASFIDPLRYLQSLDMPLDEVVAVSETEGQKQLQTSDESIPHEASSKKLMEILVQAQYIRTVRLTTNVSGKASRVPLWVRQANNVAKLNLLGAFDLSSVISTAPADGRETTCCSSSASSNLTELDITLNHHHMAFPSGFSALQKVFFEYCSFTNLSALADGRVVECFLSGCRDLRVFPSGMRFLKKLTLNWCAYIEDISALSFKEKHKDNGNEGKDNKVEDRMWEFNHASEDEEESSPPLEAFIMSNNFTVTSLPGRMLFLRYLKLDKCVELLDISGLGGLPLLEVLEITACTLLATLPSWSSEGDQHLNSCALRKLTLQETAVEDYELTKLLHSAAKSLEEIDLCFSAGLTCVSVSPSIKEATNGSNNLLPKLHTFIATSCPNLEYVPALAGCENLQTLTLSDCQKLSALPVGEDNKWPALTTINLSWCTLLAMTTLAGGILGQDVHKQLLCPRLKRLYLTGCYQFKLLFFVKDHDETATSPLIFGLEKLVIESCSSLSAHISQAQFPMLTELNTVGCDIRKVTVDQEVEENLARWIA